MKISTLSRFIIFAVLFIALTVYLTDKAAFTSVSSEISEVPDADERPHYEIDKAEQAFYDQICLDKQTQVRMKSTSIVDAYANGMVRGTWKAKQFTSLGQFNYGFRTIGSAYDREKDIIYVVSAAGHIFRIDYDKTNASNTQWISMNHSHAFMSVSRKEWFDILNFGLENSESRMLRSYDDQLQYSDDEGRNWQSSQGVAFQLTDDQGCVAGSTKGNRAVVLVKVGGKQDLVISYDGITYAACGLDLASTSYDTKLMKPHFSDDVYVIARNKSTSKLSIYKMTADSEVCTLLHSPTLTMAAPTKVIGTYTGGQYHFYYIQGNDIYYSADEGAVWTKTVVTNYGNTDGNSFVRTVHPTQPETLFRGYLDVYMSSDRGATFSNWGHKLGWDVHHMRMYQLKDSTYMHLIGKDFGVFLSTSPEVRNSYYSINNSAPSQMSYDMDVSDLFNTAFTANQDRGSMSFDNSDRPSKADIRTTDGLRITLAHQEKSIWTWMYFGTVYHQANPGYGTSELSSVSIAGNWTAGCMVAHPNADKDAVVVAHEGDFLKILTYDEARQSISVEDHPFDFGSFTGSKVSSFGYSPLNSNFWYVAVADGQFLFSHDGGATFVKSSSGKLAPGNDQSYNYTRNQQVIKASKIDAETVYFAGVKNAFYISTDGGKTFKNHNTGLNVWRFRDFELSDDEKYIFAACAYGGAWVFSVDDDKWFKMDGPNVPYVDFTAVSYTPSKGMVQFGTYGYGVLDFQFERATNALTAPSGFEAVAQSYSAIDLTWDASSQDMDNYVVRRSVDLKTFEDVARVSAGTFSYRDSLLSPGRVYYYRIYASKDDVLSLPSLMKSTMTQVVPDVVSSQWQLIFASSEDGDNVGEKSFDNKTTTAWQSAASSVYPHELKIDLGSEQELATFTYTPAETGVVKSYVLYASNDSTQWGSPIAEGTWTSPEDAFGINQVEVKKARYVRFVALEGFDSETAAIAELSFSSYYDSNLETPFEFGVRSVSSSYVFLSWNNVSQSIDGVILERKEGDSFVEIARLSPSQNVYRDSYLTPYTNYQYRISAYRNADYSEVSEVLSVTTTSVGLLDRSLWRVINTSSFERGMRGLLAIDNNMDTWWSSSFSSTVDEMPHEMIIDLGQEETIKAFSYFPPVDSVEGMIKDYEFYVSNSTTEWGLAKASGSFQTKGRQNVGVVSSSGRYVKLVAKSGFDGSSVAAVAEILLWEKYPRIVASLPTVEEPKIAIFPVPFTNHLTIKLDESDDFSTVELLSADGRVILIQPLEANEIVLNIKEDLPAGIYLLRFKGRGASFVKKVMKR